MWIAHPTIRMCLSRHQHLPDIQDRMLGLISDLLNQKLHFNKILRGFVWPTHLRNLMFYCAMTQTSGLPTKWLISTEIDPVYFAPPYRLGFIEYSLRNLIH